MRLSIGQYSSGLSEIIAEHNGESLEWRGNTYNRTKLAEPEKFFDDINGYWAGLPFTQQNEIWAIYKQINDTLNVVLNGSKTHSTLQILLKKLYLLHPLDSLNYWIRMKSKVKYPPDLKTEFTKDDIKEMTYLRSDYEGLLTLTLALRIVLPVFSKYMAAAEKESGGQFKEYLAMSLLATTNIAECAYMERLRVYVAASSSIDENKPSLALILGGLGSAQIPAYLLALAVTRRVAVAELKTSGDPVVIISNVWNYISSTSRDLDKKFGGSTKDKNVTESASEDDKSSVVENYKIKQEVTEAATIPDTVFMERYIDVPRQIDPTITEQEIKRLWNHQRILSTFTPLPFQLYLAGWVLAPTVSARSIEHLEYNALIIALVTAQGLLWHWGFPDLAALMTATKAPPAPGMEFGSSMMSRGYKAATPEMIEVLDSQYPYWKRTSKKGGRTIDSNYALIGVRELMQEINASDWELKAPKDLIESVTMLEYDNGYAAPLDLEYQLVDFIIKNNNRKNLKAGV